MKLNEVRPARGAVHARKRRGCGTASGHGGTSTKGHKGSQARAGGALPAWFEGGQMPLQRRLPKRGFHNHTRQAYQVINVSDLARFDAGSNISPQELRDAGLVRRRGLPVKLLGEGTLDRALTVRVHAASQSAMEKVSQSGGTVELLTPTQA
jgi:large subunit ribosomal protein L15